MVYKILFAALCSVLLVSCLAAPNSRIVGGSIAKPNQFPYQVSVELFGTHKCGGSIITEDYVLTAAHCVDPRTPLAYGVKAGNNTLNSEMVQAARVIKIFVHEDYRNFLNDIALLRLSSPFEFSPSVQPIEIFPDEVPGGSDIEISGWGYIKNGGPISKQLKFNTLTALTREECYKQIKENYIGILCLGHTINNGACHGDSGGPAAYQGKLVGVANFVYGGCGSFYPDGYAKVSYFRKWIENKMNAD